MPTFQKTARKTLNILLSPSGFQLMRPGEKDHIKSFIPCKETVDEARKAMLSVGDYIDAKYHHPGATQTTIDQLADRGVFGGRINSVCEIGPGSGRYLEKIQRLCAPHSYEIYETDPEWADWLVRTYHVSAHEADGTSLRDTPSGSVDLVHSHKVFVYLPFIVTFQYFSEMIRVARPGGRIIFDIVSEGCMSDATIEQWIASRAFSRCMIPRDFVIGFFARRQCSLRSSFLAPMLPGQSEYLIFAREEA
jgi:SAM-dependent methyltransferase